MSGSDYVQHALLYHVTRVDHRHSLSLAFPSLYLSPWFGPYLAVPQLLIALLPTMLTFFGEGSAALSPKHKLTRSIALQTAVENLRKFFFIALSFSS